MPYWHKHNPWAEDNIAYIAVKVAAELCEYSWPASETLKHFRQYGDKLDAYILIQPSGLHCIGVRYGPEGNEYISPNPNQAKVKQYLKERNLDHV